jgi:hypothetical protein
MNTHPDFEELFRLLEEKQVEYMVVGGYAVAFHGYPRFTKDIDIFFDASPVNVERLREVLIDFGFEPDALPEDAFTRKNALLVFGAPPTRVDLLNSIDGVSFAEARSNAIRGRYGAVEVWFIGRADLIRNKRATPRAQDKVDADELSRDAR